MNERLAEYAAGALDPVQRAEVEAHVADCAGCGGELAGWLGVASAADPQWTPPSSADLVYRVMVRSALDFPPAPARRPPWFWLALVRAEARLLRVPILLASAMVMALGVAMATLPSAVDGWASDVLAIVAPVVAAAGISAVYGPQRDPAFEIVATTQTQPRLILLIRIALVFGYDLALALAASGAVALVGADPTGLWTLVDAWLGPMALLSALSLVLVVWVGADVALGAALVLWSLRVLASSVFADVTALVEIVRAVWSTNLVTGTLTIALFLAAVIHAGRGEPIRRSRATHSP